MPNKFDILVIDDEQVIIDSILKVASMNNYSVDYVTFGKLGLEKIIKGSYKLIICDVMLPDINGFQILEHLEKSASKIPIIITTGYSTIDNAIKALTHGAIDYLSKPFTFEELESCISRGMKFSEIIKNLKNCSNYDSQLMYHFTPCPANYLRFGFSTWVNPEKEGLYKCGILDLYLKTIGQIEKVSMPPIGSSILQGQEFMQITDEFGYLHKVFAPISGKIILCNEKIDININLIEKDPYFDGWLALILPDSLLNDKKNLVSCSSDRY